MKIKFLRIERVKNIKGFYEFGFWLNVNTDEYFALNIGVAFFKSLHWIIYFD